MELTDIQWSVSEITGVRQAEYLQRYIKVATHTAPLIDEQ